MTKRIVLPVLAITALGISLTGCVPIYHPNANGPRVTDDRDIDNVEAVEVRTDGDLTVTLGDTPSLTIKAPKNVIDRLTSDIVDGVLVLSVKGPQFGFGLGDIDYELTVPRLSGVSIEGSSDVTADFSGADDVTISIDGSGDVDGRNIDAETVTTSIDGSGDIQLEGTTETQSIAVDGSADFGGGDLVSRATTIDLSGSGDLEVHATETLDVDLSGSGEVRYRGGAKVTSDISGSGSVVED
jgi:hypothetical protein